MFDQNGDQLSKHVSCGVPCLMLFIIGDFILSIWGRVGRHRPLENYSLTISNSAFAASFSFTSIFLVEVLGSEGNSKHTVSLRQFYVTFQTVYHHRKIWSFYNNFTLNSEIYWTIKISHIEDDIHGPLLYVPQNRGKNSVLVGFWLRGNHTCSKGNEATGIWSQNLLFWSLWFQSFCFQISESSILKSWISESSISESPISESSITESSI